MRTTKELSWQRRGFTLTEAALVLGIVGLVLGAVWVAFSSVQSGRQAAKAQSEIQAVVHNLRTLYGAQGGFDTSKAMPRSITVAMAAAGVFPADMVVNAATGDVRSAWGNAVDLRVTGGNQFLFLDAGSGSASKEMCSRMISLNIGDGRDPTLLAVTDGAGGSSQTVGTTGMMGPSDAVAFCSNKDGYGLEFRLK